MKNVRQIHEYFASKLKIGTRNLWWLTRWSIWSVIFWWTKLSGSCNPGTHASSYNCRTTSYTDVFSTRRYTEIHQVLNVHVHCTLRIFSLSRTDMFNQIMQIFESWMVMKKTHKITLTFKCGCYMYVYIINHLDLHKNM